MGAGIAHEALKRFPFLDLTLGAKVNARGNHCYFMKGIRLCSFPTKYHWNHPSDKNLIIQSARELRQIAFGYSTFTFYLPRPGCGFGGLRWEDVKPLIQEILPDNVIVVSR